jgi:hypothetical protein
MCEIRHLVGVGKQGRPKTPTNAIGASLTRLMTTLPEAASNRWRWGQLGVIFPGVDIARVRPVDLDLVHPLGMRITELPYPLVSVEHPELSEKLLGKEHRMAWTTAIRDAHNRRLPVSPPRYYSRNGLTRYARLISENQDQRFWLRVKRLQASSNGWGTTLVKIRRLYKPRALESHVPADLFRLMTDDNHHFIEDGCLHTPHNPAEHGRILPREKLFGLLA